MLQVSQRLYDGLSFSRGQKIRLRIPVTGRPFPKVTWIKDGEVIEPGGRFEVTEGDNHAMLVVHDAEKSDKGEYTIQVENLVGTDTAKFPIIVTGRFYRSCITLIMKIIRKICHQQPSPPVAFHIGL